MAKFKGQLQEVAWCVWMTLVVSTELEIRRRPSKQACASLAICMLELAPPSEALLVAMGAAGGQERGMSVLLRLLPNDGTAADLGLFVVT